MQPLRRPANQSSERRIGEAGVVMVEGMLGVMLLVFMTMAAIQMMLTANGALSARQAAQQAARAYALTGCHKREAAYRAVELTKATSLGGLVWAVPELECPPGTGRAWARVTVSVSTVLPGAGALTGGSVTDPIKVIEEATYPLAGAA